jgi:FAD/FMN-containing dehydrogenase/Fe-S oxidoreductase
MTTASHREIPYNYTSADDRQAVSLLLGPDVWRRLEALRARRVTGRSARLLMRFFGEMLIYRRNAYLYQELLDSPARRSRLFRNLETDLDIIQKNAGDEALVLEVIQDCRRLLDGLRQELDAVPERRRRIRSALAGIVGKQSVLFDPFTLVSHSTDATDWRLFLPAAVVTPTDEAQVAPLLAAIGTLGLKAIPRGGGTGLTGGAVPVRRDCVVVNTEKLDRIRGVTERAFTRADGSPATAAVLELEAGVITEAAMEYAAHRGLVFATDPTSAWASTIGGNIAENAGGKDCVLWGTCIDNVLSFQLALPSGQRWTIRRVGHPLRKILPDDRIAFEVVVVDASGNSSGNSSGNASSNAADALVRRVELAGTEIRKKGLWKDITNKALGGLPGLQKEGTDGVITSAEFVLYPAYEASQTLCLEFFGPDMDEASRVILALSRAFPDRGEEALMALEHFDDQYVRAIGYKVKAPRAETPKAVLLIDVVGHTPAQAARGVSTIRSILEEHPNTVLFQAADAAEAKRFWADRKKLGAIAAHTNAFKLNEDIVLPLESLAEFARWVDATNLDEERWNQQLLVQRLEELLHAVPPEEDGRWLPEKIEGAVELCRRAATALPDADERALRAQVVPKQLRRELSELVRGYAAIAQAMEALFEEVRGRLIVLATHMHAGDGNVHVNIPVLSNDLAMMKRAELTVDKVMAKVVELGGVVSGEHGIGITKLKYLEPERILALSAHRRLLDPAGVMNPGKLEDLSVLEHIYTPSFNLLELEARILQHGHLEELAQKIAHCVRCGRCKQSCCVFHPARGLFFHPRNKNLAIGALIEALLYDAQRDRSTSFELLRYLEDVADHCTICHKCLKPCPVDIDTGEVSVLERGILAERGYKHTRVATKAALRFLDSSSPAFNRIARAGMRVGFALQRVGVRLAAPFQTQDGPPEAYPLQLFRSPLPRLDPGTLRDVLPPCEPDQVLFFEPEGEPRGSVFYFPGCGSERLFSRVSMATLHVLQKLGIRVVLPPPFLCCGFPAHSNAKTELHGRTVLRDTILFSQIREMFSYLSFDACVVTCGTCREALHEMEAEKIFGAPIADLARFAADQGLRVNGGGPVLYHAPCHDSLEGKADQVMERLGGYQLAPVPHCCSEAGTLAMSRPDISDSMLHRKTAAMVEALAGRPPGPTILTNCPSCLQGLGRNEPLGVTPRHVAVELALRLSGPGWIEELRASAVRAKPIHF